MSKAGEDAVWKAITGAGEHRVYVELRASADLVEKYGKKAVMVLAGRGISVTEAQKILSSGQTEEEIVRGVMESERDSLRRRFLAQKR